MNNQISEFIKNALNEDVYSGDVTSLACLDENTMGEIKLIAKDDCYISGLKLANHIYNFFDNKVVPSFFFHDGDFVKKNSVVFSAVGKQRSLLATERLILNCMQRMSGITTKTKKIVEEIKGTNVKILDTRKTCPNIRFLDKLAVKLGGGFNHRFGLYDQMMIKENHIDFCGGIEKSIKKCVNYNKLKGNKIPIIIEVRNIEELQKVLNVGGVNRIILDNFNIKMTKEAVRLTNSKISLESSGNITIENIRKYAECGVNYISVGSLTHSVKSIDLSMLIT